MLLDVGSHTKLGMWVAQEGFHSGDGVITGQGTIGGRSVCVFAKDMSVHHGTLAEVHARKICRLQELALESRIPIIGMFDTAGARLEADMSALGGFAPSPAIAHWPLAPFRRFR
jgi:propionyl-CoA carboxylase beta chain